MLNINEENKFMLTSSIKNNQVSNELKQSFEIMIESIKTAEKSYWSCAYAMADIVNNESYKNGGYAKSVNELAKKTGINVNLWYRAKLAVNNLKELKRYRVTDEKITVSKCAILARLENNQHAFIAYCKEKEINWLALGEQKLEEHIRNFKQAVGLAVDNKKEATEAKQEATEAKQEAKQESKIELKDVIPAHIEKGYLYITIKNEFYAVPLEDLEDYKVETE